MKTMFTVTTLVILLFKGRSVLAHAHRGTGSERVKYKPVFVTEKK